MNNFFDFLKITLFVLILLSIALKKTIAMEDDALPTEGDALYQEAINKLIQELKGETLPCTDNSEYSIDTNLCTNQNQHEAQKCAPTKFSKLQCDICYKNYKTEQLLELHRNVRHLKLFYVCANCKESFNHIALLEAHQAQNICDQKTILAEMN